ncbi:MAG: tetratricopeptide repeat protein [Planctomycetota bacterium]
MTACSGVIGCREQSPATTASTTADAAETAAETRPADDVPANTTPNGTSTSAAPRTLDPLPPPLARIFDRIRRGETGVARLELTRYLNNNPQNGQARFLQGLSYHEEKSYALAREHFDTAIEVSPDYYASYYFNGWAAYYLGQLSEAKQMFRMHLTFQPNEGDTHFALGLIAMDENELDVAATSFQRAIELQTGVPARKQSVAKAHARYGEVLTLQNRFEDARDQLTKATTLNPALYEAWYQLSRVLTRLGDDEGAALALARHDEITAILEGPPAPPANAADTPD